MCDIYNIHTQKILQAFHPNSMKLKNGYYESCFCGFTMWRNRRLWFMLLFSLCTWRVACIFHRYGKKSVKHMDIVHANLHVRERKKNEYFESKCKHFNVFCCCYWNVLCKENSNKVLWNWHQVKVTQVKREHKTHPLSDQLKCQGPQREQRPNSINVNFNPSDAVRNHAGLSRLDTTTWNNPMRRATNHLKRKSEFVLPYFWLSDPLYSFLRPRTTHLFSLHAIQICFSGLYFESPL